MQNPWRSFEELPGLTAVPAAWRDWMQDQFPQFRELCLEPDTRRPYFYPCPVGRGCAYAITPEPNGTFSGTCQREPIRCPHAAFSLAEITPLRLSWSRLGRALCRAFDLNPQMVEFYLPPTRQIGSWSSDCVPVILTIQCETDAFHLVIAALGNRLRRPFILFAPTNLHIDAHAQELLANAQAEFFSLENTVRVTHNGTLTTTRPPGELFSKLAPKPVDETAADGLRTAFALIDELDKESAVEPKAFEVFRLYCMKGWSIPQITAELKCGVATVDRRLKQIQERTGKHPKYFRQLSGHFENVKSQFRDSRARRIKGEAALNQPDDDQDSFD